MSKKNYFNQICDAFKTGRELIKSNFDIMQKKYNVGELYKEEDGSIEITELNNIEQKLKEIHKTNSKITTVALITGIMSRPIYTSRITYMMSRAKNTPSSTQ